MHMEPQGPEEKNEIAASEGIPEPLPKTYGTTPYAKALMKALGGDPRFMTKNPNAIKRWGMDRPNSVLELIPDKAFVEIVETLPEELFSQTETQLVNLCPVGTPDRTDRRMRHAFWAEYESAAKEMRTMDLEAMAYANGARNWVAFADHLCATPALMAWFISPPAEYKVRVDADHARGLERLEEILDLPIVDPASGRVNVGVGMLLLQAFKLLDVRKYGMPTQKIAQLHAHQQLPDASAGEKVTMDPDSMRKKLEELDQMLTGTAFDPGKSVELQKPADIVVEAEVVTPEKGDDLG